MKVDAGISSNFEKFTAQLGYWLQRVSVKSETLLP